jgi:hypothetical protein
MRSRSQTLKKLRPCYAEKIFVVGGDKLVRPMAAFIEDGKIERLCAGLSKGSII